MATNRLAQGLPEVSGSIWSFAGRTFDESRLELCVGGKVVDLELKPLEVLLYLLQHAGEVVSKSDLLDAVWPGLNVVEGSLSTAVYKLRKALGDDDSSIVVTVPRVGYRLAATANAEAGRPSSWPAKVALAAGKPVPGREHWLLLRPLDTSSGSEVWLAEHPKTHELRVFKFVSKLARLRTLKREVTVFRFLRESLEDGRHLVQILEWNFETEPYFLESEYGGPNLAEWPAAHGGLANIPLQRRLNVLAEIARAVAGVHAVGVLHKDLKPANVLVARLADGEEQIKIADFGSALLLEPSRLEALGITRLGLTQTAALESSSFSGTLLYLAPEVFSGKPATAQSDVYALGVMLYQMVVGEFRKPLSPGWEEEVADPLLREDIAAAVCGDPARRLRSPAELAERLENLEARRAERLRMENERQQQELAERKRAEARARRPWIALACVMLLALAASLYVLFRRRAPAPPVPSLKTVAVLPFQNAGGDKQFDYLSLPLADEVASTLSYARGLSVEPFFETSEHAHAGLDPRKVGAEMHVASVVTGRFLPAGDQLHLTLEAIDVKSGRVLWADTLDAPARNMVELREKIVARTQGVLAATLGGSAYTVKGTRPTNNEAYELYLRALAMPLDSGTNQQALAMLERSVALDPNFAPAWLTLGRRYYVEVRYGTGGNDMSERYTTAVARAVALDPDYLPAVANWIGVAVEDGDETKAMQQTEDLIRQHPESSDAHYILNYTLRYAGLIDEAQRQCDLAFQLDPHNTTSGLRSCAIVPALRGDYQRAAEYLRLDPDSDFSKAITLLALLRGGKANEALKLGAPHIRQWPSYDMLVACAEHRPPAEIEAAAAKVRVSVDPEANYLAAANLAYCGQNEQALALLSKAVEGHYCSYPVMDSDRFFNDLRGTAEFATIRADAIACQQNYASQWQRIQGQHRR